MTGLGEASAIIGITAFSLHKIHQGFILLSTAKNFGAEADKLRRDIEYEHYRYFVWEDRKNSEMGGTENPDLRDPDKAMEASILEELQSIFPKGEALENRYNLKIDEAEEELDLESGRSKLRNFISDLRLQRKFDLMTANVINSRAGKIKKLRWAAFDKDSMTKYVQDVRTLVSRLVEMLFSKHQHYLVYALQSMVRKGIKVTTDGEQLKLIGRLNPTGGSHFGESSDNGFIAVGEIKATRMEFGLDTTRKEQPVFEPVTGPKAISQTFIDGKKRRSRQIRDMRKKFASFLWKDCWSLPGNREFSMEREGLKRLVLVERRSVELPSRGAEADKLRHRIEGLAVLLSQLDAPSLHSLRCSGFLEDSHGFAFVYDLPPEIPAVNEKPAAPIRWDETGNPRRITNLREIVDDDSLVRAEFAMRKRIASALAETILHLHTAGWLHKGIRPDNVLFTDFARSQWSSSNSFQGPFLAGYDFAREHDPRETSDELPSVPETNIYRHPETLGQERPSFRPEFDLYALGLVLLEVGVWTKVQSLLPSVYQKVYAHQNFSAAYVLQELKRGEKDSVLAKLSFCTDTKFAQAVMLCLEPESFFEEANRAEDFDPDENLENSVRLQEAVLARLESCTR